jgi:O-antigen ligase
MRYGYVLAFVAVVSAAVAALTGRYGAAYYAQGSTLAKEYQAPHAFVTLLVLSAPFVLYEIAARAHRWSRIAATGVLISMVALIILSEVRSGLLAIVATILATLAAMIRRGYRRQLAALFGAAVASWYIFSRYGGQMGQRLSSLVDELAYSPQSAGSGRSMFWTTIADKVWSSPVGVLFGHGGGADSAIIQSNLGLSIGAHNDFLELTAVGGLLLLAAYICFVSRPLILSFRASKAATYSQSFETVRISYWGALVGFFILAATNGVLGYQGSLAFGLISGATSGYAQSILQQER